MRKPFKTAHSDAHGREAARMPTLPQGLHTSVFFSLVIF